MEVVKEKEEMGSNAEGERDESEHPAKERETEKNVLAIENKS